MNSKVILNKNFCKAIFFFTLVFSLVIAKKIYASENLHYLSSYYGSLLAGQIAKYNNENKIASKYYRFANQKNPKNTDILELSLMSSILSGDIKLALEDLEKYDNNLSTENSKISQLLKFIKYIKNAFPYWLVSIIGIIILFYVFRNEKHFYSLFFAFIAAVTFPHAIVMMSMFAKKSIK